MQLQKLAMARNKPVYLVPINPLTYVSVSGVAEIIPPDLISIPIVGEKAFGLNCLPKLWTLPFIVITDELLTLYSKCVLKERDQLLSLWSRNISLACLSVGIDEHDSIIVRSSGCKEGLDDRGRFYSIKGSFLNIKEPLAECLSKIDSDSDLKEQKVPLIVQKCVIPISASGHLSNERRFYEDKRDWLGEYEEIAYKSKKPFGIHLRNWRKKIVVGNSSEVSLNCNLSAHISEVLKLPAAWACEKSLRLHFEWVWDGERIYIVQADQEREANGVDPTKCYSITETDLSSFKPECLHEITKELATRFNKINNVFTYIDLELPVTTLYVLDDQNLINNLATGEITAGLKNDISFLVKGSLVIRIDIATDDKFKRQLLPRTEEVRDAKIAIDWLKEKSAEIKGKIIEDMIFIFHNFVPAVSSAFAYAVPGERKVQIESLWGLPEGLYYNAHDKYIVDTKIPPGGKIDNCNYDCNFDKFVVSVSKSCKRFFVSPEKDGHWATKTLKPPFDWKKSIENEEWIKQIAFESRRIAEAKGHPLSIMWFVGVSPQVCTRPIFPWYDEPYDSKITSRAKSNRKKTVFDKEVIIKSSSDIERLQKEILEGRHMVRRIKIQPKEEKLLRDKNTLKTIGELAKKIDAIILLEGGVLSHAYYQLLETKAVVEVLHPFEGFEDKQEFNKLVRDKVPSNIEKGGEIVTKTRLSGEMFLRFLREKLIEESFEVLEAIDQDSIVGELADLSEVIDTILSRLGVTHHELRKCQEAKRGKAGGFQDGLVLLETRNPLPIQKGVVGSSLFQDITSPGTSGDETYIDARDIIDRGHKIEKWEDKREHSTTIENILDLKIPVVRDEWEATTSIKDTKDSSGRVYKVKVTGSREGANLKIKLSMHLLAKQLKLF